MRPEFGLRLDCVSRERTGARRWTSWRWRCWRRVSVSVAVRRLDAAIWLLVGQGCIAGGHRWRHRRRDWRGARVCWPRRSLLAIKAVVIPAFLFRVLRAVRVRREVELVLSTRAALLVAHRLAVAGRLPGGGHA